MTDNYIDSLASYASLVVDSLASYVSLTNIIVDSVASYASLTDIANNIDSLAKLYVYFLDGYCDFLSYLLVVRYPSESMQHCSLLMCNRTGA